MIKDIFILLIKMDNNINNCEDYIAPWKQTKYLVLSSSFFLFPCFYGYYYKVYWYSNTIFLASIISINYWRDAKYCWRRYLDLIYSKIVFVISVTTGIMYIKYYLHLIIAYVFLFLIFCSYSLSELLYCRKNNNWYVYHMIFHMLMTYEQFIIINSLIEN